uniref:Terminase B n=1 Tax=Thermorudis peleae TaxID=1382356 RepID=A0A831TG64_9BACT
MVATKLELAIDHYADRPVEFVEDLIGATPDPWQAAALDALARGKSVAVRSGHGVGKTALAAWAVIWKLACFPHARVPATAPTQHQLLDILWPEIAKWIERSPIRSLFEVTATRIALRGAEKSWFAVARSSNQPERLAGYHADHLLYVVDEASGIPDYTWEVIDGARTTSGAVVLAVGNPTRRSGGFYQAFHRHRAFWETFHVSAEDSPRVSRDWVAEMAAKWGCDSDVYRVRVLGEFPLGSDDTLIPLELVEAAVERDVPPGGPVEIGVDVARYGSSETVICARQGLRALWLLAYRQRAVTEVVGLVVQAVRRLRDETGTERVRVKVDDTGVGGGVTDGLRELERELPIEVVPVTFAGGGDDHYADFPSLLWGTLRTLFEQGSISIPRDDDLIGQLATRRYTVDSRGRIRIESKEQLRARGLPSPDRADALALAFWAPTQRPVFLFGRV